MYFVKISVSKAVDVFQIYYNGKMEKSYDCESGQVSKNNKGP